MARTLIKTEAAGWFIDPENGDKKVRKADGDNLVTRAEFDAMVAGTDNTEPKAEKPKAEQVTLSSGKVVTGTTVEIRCAWVDPDNRTGAQEKLFASNFKGVKPGTAYDRVFAAGDGTVQSEPDGTRRTIKTQDAFQTRFSVANQEKWRAELRRRKNAARTKKARAAAKA